MFVETKREGEQIATRGEPSLAGFISWLETRDPDEKYAYFDMEHCACAQYAKAISAEWRSGIVYENPVWMTLDLAAAMEPHTFGALSARIRATR